MHNASGNLLQDKMSLEGIPCVVGCGGSWLKCALEDLRQNNVHPFVFAAAIRELLEKGDGKFRNILMVAKHSFSLR